VILDYLHHRDYRMALTILPAPNVMEAYTQINTNPRRPSPSFFPSSLLCVASYTLLRVLYFEYLLFRSRDG
jgi:hypothetical protein